MSLRNHRPAGSLNRRTFLKAGAATAVAAASYSRVYGANDRIAVGVIGFGLIGRVHTRSFKAQSDVNLAAVADTYGPRREAAAAMVGGNVATYADFRKILDRKDIDAVVVATPDHWHALMTMLACAAGKDVYVEKPLTLFVREGRWMVQIAQRYKRVVQVGTQQRSGAVYQQARTLLREGRLGPIVSVQCNFFRNLMPGFGNPPDQDPPAGLDWDMMLGPAPPHRYNPNRAIYHFRWFWDYSGGQMTNLGHHSLDVVHWCLDVKGPKAVSSAGGRYFLKDNCEVPDVQDVILEYPGFTTVCQYRECTTGHGGAEMGALNFLGTKGTLPLTRQGYEVFPDPKQDPIDQVARILGGHPIGGPQAKTGDGPPQFWTEGAKNLSGDAMLLYTLHARNFLECIRSRREPASDLESGHRVATACHLANLSLRTGRKIQWDAEKEEIVGDAAASAMLVRPYRKPWDAELRALGVA
ncbi:MAG: Gfo/Idh/MocA family protein [Thermoguttaceae bacterium]